MNKLRILTLTGALLFVCLCSYAQKDKFSPPFEIPEGMEYQKVGNAYILLPKNGKFHTVDHLLVQESPDEYAARKFIEIELRLRALEDGLETLESQVNLLTEELRKLNSSLNPQ